MAIIDLTEQNIAETPEPTVVPADTEAKLRIIKAEYKHDPEKNNGNPFLMVYFEIDGDPTAKEISKFFGMPCSGLDKKKNNANKRALKYLGEAFGVDFSRPFEEEELVGLEGWCILGLESTEKYGEQNFIKRFVTGA